MKGWQFTKTGVAPKLIEQEDPKAGQGEVVLEMKAAGLCHSDVGALEDESWMEIITAAPLIFGHEAAGQVAEVGEGVSDFEVGDRVGVAPINPETNETIGYQRDGGYATKLCVPANQLIKLPDGVTFTQGAAATDAGMTSYHALFEVGGAKKGDKVGIVGIGGLGQFALQMALATGCEVYAADVAEHARQFAEKSGAHEVAEDIAEFADENLDIIIDYAGFKDSFNSCLKAAAFKGTIVLVGMGNSTLDLNVNDVILKQLTIKGSNGGNAEDIAGVYEFFQEDSLHPELTEIEFEEIGEGLEKLKEGKVSGRLVARINREDGEE